MDIMDKAKGHWLGCITCLVIKCLVFQGARLIKPELCPQLVYNIMCHCWSELPHYRPTFRFPSDNRLSERPVEPYDDDHALPWQPHTRVKLSEMIVKCKIFAAR